MLTRLCSHPFRQGSKAHTTQLAYFASSIKKVISKRKDWFDPTYSEQTPEQDKIFIRPEEKKVFLRQRMDSFYDEDHKNKLLGARIIEPQVVVEDDLVFGQNLPDLLDLSKATASEMYGVEKQQNFQKLIDL